MDTPLDIPSYTGFGSKPLGPNTLKNRRRAAMRRRARARKEAADATLPGQPEPRIQREIVFRDNTWVSEWRVAPPLPGPPPLVDVDSVPSEAPPTLKVTSYLPDVGDVHVGVNPNINLSQAIYL